MYLGMVLFDDGEDLQVIEVPLISSSKFEKFVEFKVVLIEPQGKCSLGNNQKENISKKYFAKKSDKCFVVDIDVTKIDSKLEIIF